MHCHLSEGRSWLSQVLAISANGPLARRAEAALGEGVLAEMQGDFADAIPALEEAERLFRYIGDLPGTAFARLLQGEIRLFQGDEGTQSLLEESLELIRSLGNAALTAYPLKNLGHLARLQGDHDRADVLLQEALACSRDAAHGWGIADALNSLAEVAIQRGDLRSAARYLGEALPLYWDVKDTFCIAIALGDLAVVSRMNGQLEQCGSPVRCRGGVTGADRLPAMVGRSHRV